MLTWSEWTAPTGLVLAASWTGLLLKHKVFTSGNKEEVPYNFTACCSRAGKKGESFRRCLTLIVHICAHALTSVSLSFSQRSNPHAQFSLASGIHPPLRMKGGTRRPQPHPQKDGTFLHHSLSRLECTVNWQYHKRWKEPGPLKNHIHENFHLLALKLAWAKRKPVLWWLAEMGDLLVANKV